MTRRALLLASAIVMVVPVRRPAPQPAHPVDDAQPASADT